MYDQKVLKSTRCRRDAAILTLLKHLLGSRLISFDWHKWFQTFRSSKYKRKLVPRNFFMWKLPLWSVLSHCSICQHPNLAYQKVGKSGKKCDKDEFLGEIKKYRHIIQYILGCINDFQCFESFLKAQIIFFEGWRPSRTDLIQFLLRAPTCKVQNFLTKSPFPLWFFFVC